MAAFLYRKDLAADIRFVDLDSEKPKELRSLFVRGLCSPMQPHG